MSFLCEYNMIIFSLGEKRNPTYFKDCVTVTLPGLSTNRLQRFGHVTCGLVPGLVLTVGGFGEQAGKHMRVTEMVFTDLHSFESYKVTPDVDNRIMEG